MYSGSDSTESANYNQWPLNPTFFQNMPNEQVDWAALAQQWIQMKEAGPPIPGSRSSEPKKENNLEKEKIEFPSNISEDGSSNPSWNNAPIASESLDNSNANWNWRSQKQQQQPSNWDWSNSASWNPQLNPPQLATPTSKSGLLPTTNKGYTTVDPTNDVSDVNSGYSTSKNNDFGGSFPIGHQSNNSRYYKPHNRRYSKVNIPRNVTPPANIPSTSEVETSGVGANSASLDASKRKQLPAWIREGLEKMERDKLKQMEREKEREKHDIYTEKIKEQEKETMEILKDTINERRRSKFDSDEDQSPKRKDEGPKAPEPLSHDELMLLVRRTMTEILLKVTNEAIQSVCAEERQRYAKKIQSFNKISGKLNVSAKLGLGIYGSDSASESEDSGDSSRRDSDDELKSIIRKRKADFIHTERTIEDKLFQAEQKKGNAKAANEDEEAGGNNSSENERSEKNSKKEEDSNAKSKNNVSKYHRNSSGSSAESEKGSRSSRKKSSSRSRESSVSSKRRHKSRSRDRDRGYTPEKKRRHNNKSPKRSKSRSRSYERRHSSDRKYTKEKRKSRRSRTRSRSRTSRRSRSRSRTLRRSRSRSSSYRSRRSSEASSRSKRKRSRSPRYSRSSRRSRSRSHNKSSRAR